MANESITSHTRPRKLSNATVSISHCSCVSPCQILSTTKLRKGPRQVPGIWHQRVDLGKFIADQKEPWHTDILPESVLLNKLIPASVFYINIYSEP